MSTTGVAVPPRRETPPTTPGTSRSHPRRRALFGRQPIGLALVLPFLAYVAVVYLYPLGYAVSMSLRDYFFAAPGAHADRPYTGLANAREVFFDPALWDSVGHLGIFLLINVPLTLCLSLGLATALQNSRFRSFFSVCFYLPYASSSVAVISAWIVMLAGDGVLSSLLGDAAPSPSWLVNEDWAMPVIAVFVTWKMLGFYVLTYLAALRNIPEELHEAATMDGAGAWRRLWTVTVPGVKPATTVILVLSVVNCANLFTEPYLLTSGGGPNGASTSPILLIYQQGIEQSHPGQAATIGVALTVVVMAVSMLAGTLMERSER